MPAKKQKKEKRVAISVRLKPALYRRLEALAEKTERSISWHIARTMDEEIDRIEHHVDAVLEGIASANRGELTDLEDVMKELQGKLEERRRARKAG